MVLPGIFFVYDVSPFMIQVTRRKMPLTHFLTKILAIVGGTFTTLGVLDGLVFSLAKISARK